MRKDPRQCGSGPSGCLELESSGQKECDRSGGGRRNEGQCGWSGVLSPCKGDPKVGFHGGIEHGNVMIGLMFTLGRRLSVHCLVLTSVYGVGSMLSPI